MDYNTLSASYNELYGEEQLRKAKIIRKHVRLKKSGRLLDVGCGTGIASSVFECKKIGIDPSEKLLKQAGMPVVKGKAEKLPFKDKTFELVICVTAIHNFSDPYKAIKEMKRVARGKIIITLLKKSAKFRLIDGLIQKNLEVFKVIEEEKDFIYFTSNQ